MGGAFALVLALVFGLVGKACVWIDVEDNIPTFSESMGPPRLLVPDLDPSHPIPINTKVHSGLSKYTVALRHGEVLELVSRDDGWCTQTHIRNTTTFPLLIRDWTATWSPQVDGSNTARFVAPYTGLFRLEIKGLDFHGSPHSDSHFEWRVGAHSKNGAPAAPHMTVEDAPPDTPQPLRVNPSGRPDLVVAVNPDDPAKAVLSSIAGERIYSFEQKPAVIALAVSTDGHLLATASSDWLSVYSIPDDLEHIKDELGWYGSQCDLQPTALGFLNAHTFAVGDATGAIVVRSVQTGLVLYELPKGPGAVTALSISADGLALTATYGGVAKKFTVARREQWGEE
jgi:hypothetical protein